MDRVVSILPGAYGQSRTRIENAPIGEKVSHDVHGGDATTAVRQSQQVLRRRMVNGCTLERKALRQTPVDYS
jgi:hypothetical protein